MIRLNPDMGTSAKRRNRLVHKKPLQFVVGRELLHQFAIRAVEHVALCGGGRGVVKESLLCPDGTADFVKVLDHVLEMGCLAMEYETQTGASIPNMLRHQK